MGWDDFIKQQRACAYFNKLQLFLDKRHKQGNIIYPIENNRFRAFDCTPLENIKVVILGQDPYHGEDQADGLSFSVANNIKIPPSLRNIFKELSTSIEGYNPPGSGSLAHWAKQGVLLLNSVLTVEHGQPGCHASKGWEIFTDNVIKEIDRKCDGVVFLLWGNYAQKKGKIIARKKHYVLTSTHPSPLSAYRGFLGCGHFKKTNEILDKSNKLPVNW